MAILDLLSYDIIGQRGSLFSAMNPCEVKLLASEVRLPRTLLLVPCLYGDSPISESLVSKVRRPNRSFPLPCDEIESPIPVVLPDNSVFLRENAPWELLREAFDNVRVT